MAETTDLLPSPPTLPDYSEMIMAAIEALSASTNSAIAKYIESTYGELPASHAALLTHHLNQMTHAGQIIMVGDNYMKPDPNAPTKRGRGRPKLVKPDEGQPKPSGSGRPRGRPRKKSKSAGPAEGGAKRGRGRPPKVKDSVEDGVVVS